MDTPFGLGVVEKASTRTTGITYSCRLAKASSTIYQVNMKRSWGEGLTNLPAWCQIEVLLQLVAEEVAKHLSSSIARLLMHSRLKSLRSRCPNRCVQSKYWRHVGARWYHSNRDAFLETKCTLPLVMIMYPFELAACNPLHSFHSLSENCWLHWQFSWI